MVLCLGANDMLRGIKPIHIKNNLNKILEILKENKITVLFAGMISQKHLEKVIRKNLIEYILNWLTNLRFLFYLFY